MSVNYYLSTDAGAPTLAGEVGSIINVIDACLISGFGSKAPLGWDIAFTGTNRRVYRAASGNRHYLRVDDDASATLGAQAARVVGYEAMTGIAAGVAPFPSLSDPRIAYKSQTANGTTRAWALIGDERAFYLWVSQTGVLSACRCAVAFGEPAGFGVPDAYNTMLCCGQDNTTDSAVRSQPIITNWLTNGTVQSHQYLARSYSYLKGGCGFGLGAQMAGISAAAHYFGSATQSGAAAYPNPIGNLTLVGARPLIWDRLSTDSKGCWRGRMPGFYPPMHDLALPAGAIIYGITDASPAARDLLVIGTTTAAGDSLHGQILFDVTGPWR